MEILLQLTQNRVLWTGMLGWGVAQLLKVIIVLIKSKRFDPRRLVGTGGMPSSHSSFVTSLGLAVGFTQGFDKPLFGVCVVFAFIVMYDATGIRRAAGKQAAVLNQMIERWEEDGIEIKEKRLKELLGHTPYEVLVGAILGFVIAILMFGLCDCHFHVLCGFLK